MLHWGSSTDFSGRVLAVREMRARYIVTLLYTMNYSHLYVQVCPCLSVTFLHSSCLVPVTRVTKVPSSKTTRNTKVVTVIVVTWEQCLSWSGMSGVTCVPHCRTS